MSRRLAFAQIVVGLFGSLLCLYLYLNFAPAIRESLSQLGALTETTQTELELTKAVAENGKSVIGSLKSAAEANRESLRQSERTLEVVHGSLQNWHEQLRRLSDTAQQVSVVSSKFAGVLPLEVPIVTYRMEPFRIDVPKVSLKEQTIELPYPTAKLGTKNETVDLGVTELKFSVPTLELGTAQRKVTLPASPDIQIEKREISIPIDFKISKQPLLQQEKQVLERIGDELHQVAASLDETAETVKHVDKLVSDEVRLSVATNEKALTDSIDQLDKLSSVSLPEFQSKLDQQHEQLGKAKPVFGELSKALPLVFAMISLLPLSMLVQGIWMLNHSSNR
jgi:hypothetical protein